MLLFNSIQSLPVCLQYWLSSPQFSSQNLKVALTPGMTVGKQISLFWSLVFIHAVTSWLGPVGSQVPRSGDILASAIFDFTFPEASGWMPLESAASTKIALQLSAALTRRP